MALMFLAAFGWLSLRTLLLLIQLDRHAPEVRLGRAFRLELQARGLLVRALDPRGPIR